MAQSHSSTKYLYQPIPLRSQIRPRQKIMIHVSYLLGFGKHHTLVIWPLVRHASAGVPALFYTSSIITKGASYTNVSFSISLR